MHNLAATCIPNYFFDANRLYICQITDEPTKQCEAADPTITTVYYHQTPNSLQVLPDVW